MINVGIIGAGRIGQVHAKSILSGVPQAHILAIADPYMKPAVAEWAKASGIENVYTDYKKILEDERIDAVLICASTNLHAQLSLEAIAAGKHIFCEKPIDQSVARIEEVKAALAASPKKLIYQVGFNRRYDHNYRAMRDAVAAGKIGEVQYVRVSSRDPEPPPAEYAAVSGGIFMDMMIHDLDMVRYLSGQEVVELYAQGACLIDPAIGEAGDVDTATITLKLANGALATIDGSRKAVYGYDQRGEVFGSKGCVVNPCGSSWSGTWAPIRRRSGSSSSASPTAPSPGWASRTASFPSSWRWPAASPSRRTVPCAWTRCNQTTRFYKGESLWLRSK